MAAAPAKRDQIRRAAYELFRDHGYVATTVDMICSQSEVSKGSFYWHYTSKQAVFIEILEAWTTEVVGEVQQQFEEASRTDDYVAAIAAGLERETHRGRAIVPIWVEFTALAPREPEVRDALSRFYQRIRHAVTELLRPILGPTISEDELRAVAATSFAAFTGLMLQDIADPEHDAESALTRFMAAIRIWTTAVSRPSGVPR